VVEFDGRDDVGWCTELVSNKWQGDETGSGCERQLCVPRLRGLRRTFSDILNIALVAETPMVREVSGRCKRRVRRGGISRGYVMEMVGRWKRTG